MKTISIFLCLLYAMWTEGADINVEGREREEVSFQCSHKLAWANNKYFCKDPCKDSKDILVTVGSGGRAESGRITLKDLGNGVFNVTFSQLQLSDSGTYWCAVDRPGFDSYTTVHLTVNEADETTTVIPEVSPTWPYQNISSSTQMPSGMDTSRPTNISTASNCTNGGEQNISTSTILFATFSALSVLTILVLVMCFRKCRKNSKPYPQVCSADTISADKGQVDCEYDEIGEEVQSLKKLSTRVSCSHHPKRDPPTSASAAAEDSAPLHIYENIRHIKHTRGSRYSAANVQDDSSGIYFKPLPATKPERTGDGSRGKRTNKPTNKPTATRQVTNKPTESCARNASACHSRSRSDSKEAETKSLWFGLDLSGTV